MYARVRPLSKKELKMKVVSPCDTDSATNANIDTNIYIDTDVDTNTDVIYYY